uniref:G-protein coupled receptor family C group 6 member A n=1 Tax=Mola mola TaxID=94237 RepID=A0A3Q3WIL9_MOLML
MAWATLGIYVHITLFFIILEGRHATERSITVPAATAPGDIIIGGIFPIHEDVDKNNKSFNPHPQACVRFQERDLGKALAMINAIETINKSPLLADINITLGYRIMDSCSDVSTALRATQDLTQERDSCQAGSNTSTCIQPVMAVIGASHSEMSIAIARQLTLKMIPQISYFSTAVILSDKNRFPAFMRTIPNDKYQTAAMVMLLRTHGWNWVGIVTMDGNYGRSALEHFMSAASEKGICVAFKSILPQSVTSEHVSSAITHTANTIFKNPKAHVIVSFAKPTLMMFLYRELKSQLTKAGGNMESMRRVWVASDIWSSSGSMVGNCTLDEIGHILGFSFKSGDMTSFRKYLSWLEAVGLNHTGNNPFMQELYNNLNASDASGDTELASKAVWTISEHTHADSVLSVEMAVSAIAQAVVSICRSRDCKTPGTVQPWQVLKALWMQEFNFRGESYKFDSSGDINLGYDVIMWRSDRGKIFVHEIIAHYHPDYNNFTFTNNSTTELQRLKDIISKCSNSCIPGEFKKTTEGQHTCCYECMNCTENYFSNSTDMDQCLSCDKDEEWSRKGSSRCTPKEHLYFSWNDIFAVVLLTLSALGILLALLVSALFLHQRETPVVKAAGGPLSQAILFSLVISYISAIMFVGRPNNLQCRARQVLFGISFTLCVSCILVKTLQILLAFQFNPELQVVLRKLYKPYAIIIICVALQAVTCIVWLVLKSPYHHTIRQQTTVLEHCHEGSYLAFGVMLAYIAILSFVCFICAFKGRKLPEQYNEAKFITFSMLLYLISWLLFVPIYVTTSGMYLPAVEMVVILISNYGILSCHFFPKCYIIFFKREQNTKSAFRKTLYEYSSKSSDSFSTSPSQTWCQKWDPSCVGTRTDPPEEKTSSSTTPNGRAGDIN